MRERIEGGGRGGCTPPFDRGAGPTGDGGRVQAKRTTSKGAARADRASQFMPFAALTGYYDLVRRQERVREERRDPTDEEAVELSRAIARMHRGDSVRVTFHDGDAYRSVSGAVEGVDARMRLLQVAGMRVRFDDVLSIDLTGTRGEETGTTMP